MKTYRKIFNLLALTVSFLAMFMINCGGNDSGGHGGGGSGGVVACNPDNGECSEQYFENTPFTDLDDFMNQIEQFKSDQFTVYHADIDNYLLFGDSTSAFINSAASQTMAIPAAATTPNEDFELDFLDLYLLDSNYSVVCIYKFIETNNMLDPINYQIKTGLMLARYDYSITEGKWLYSGESQIYRYDYMSQNIDDHRVITASFLSDESQLEPEQSLEIANLHTLQTASTGLTLVDIDKIIGELYKRPGLKYVRVLPDIVIQVDRFKKEDEQPGQFSTCSQIEDWRLVPHMNVRIWAYPRGDGSAEQSLGLNPRYIPLAPHLYLQWFADNKQGKHQNPGYLISNWHIGYVVNKRGEKCYLFAETNWPSVNDILPGKIPSDKISKYSYSNNKYNCFEVCDKRWDQIPWIPWGVPIPDAVINRIIQEINNNAPKMVPTYESLAAALGTAATPSILSALENIGPVLWSSATASKVVSTLEVALTATESSMAGLFFMIKIDIPFMEFDPMGVQPALCPMELEQEGRCSVTL